MLTYSMEDRGTLPLYEHLYRCIRADIFSGALPPGSRLPSKRSLAEHLRISVITVESAYQQLLAEGYLYALPKRGFFVAQVDRLPPGEALPEDTPADAAGWRLDLRSNHVDTSRFPVSTWAKLTRQVLSEGGSALLSPVPHQGLPQLRQAIADNLRSFRGMQVSPDQILVGAGAEYLYLLLIQLLGLDAVYAVEDPGYPKLRSVYTSCGALCRPVPLDASGMEPEALRACGASVAHISPAHHFPTGITMPIGRRQALLRWAETCGGTIIEDDYDSEFRFTGRPIPTLQSIDSSGRVVYMNTFSQTISPSLRVGFMVLPRQLLERYRRELDFYSCTVPTLDQHVLARFLSGGHYEQHLARMRKEYRSRRAAVLEAFGRSPFSDRVSISEQGAGLHFLLHLHTDTPDDILRRRAEERGVRLGFLCDYAANPLPEHAHTLVISYAGLAPQQLPETMSVLEEIFTVL